MENNIEQENLELYPIYEIELDFDADDVSFFPIFESDIMTNTTIEVKDYSERSIGRDEGYDKRRDETIISPDAIKSEIPGSVDQLTRDLFGEVIETQPIIKEKIRNVTCFPGGETKKDTTEITTDSATNGENGLSVLDALKLNGRYPTKKDKDKNVVVNSFVIDKATKSIPSGDNVLFAYFSWITYCSMAKVKQTKNDTLKLPFFDNHSTVFVVTDSSIVLSSILPNEKEAIVIPRSDVVGVNHVFEKKLTSVGQTQIQLKDEKIIVISIDKVIGGGPDQKQFEDFKETIDRLLGMH